MASTNIARLGVVLGLDMAEFTAGIEQAVKENRKLSTAIKSDSNAAAKEIMALKYATDTYNKSLTKTEEIQKATTTGRYAFATKELKEQLMAAAKAYDQVATSAANAQKAQGTGMMGAQGKQLNPQQLAALGYQTTDIITGLAGGQNPLLVLVQQGGQLRDQFGGVTNVFKAFASVLSPMRILLGGVGAVLGVVGYGFVKGSEEAAKFRDALILTNNYSGLTYNNFLRLSEVLASKEYGVNAKIADTRSLLNSLASSGKFTSQSLMPVAEVLSRIAKLSGETGEEVFKKLGGSFDGTASSAKSLNETFNFLTLDQYKYIEQLERQGKRQESAAYTANLLNDSLKGQTRELGTLEKVLSSIGRGWSDFWDSVYDIGRTATPEQELKKLADLIELYSPFAKVGLYKKEFEDAKNAYLKMAADLAKKQEDLNKDADLKAKRRQELDEYNRAGGATRVIDLEFEAKKQSIESEAELRMQGANQFARIEIEATKEKELAKLNLEKRFRDVGYALETEERKALAAKLIAIDEKATQKKLELSRQKELEFSKNQFKELDSIEKEKEKLNLYQSQLLMTEQDYQIGLARLETEQKIAEIMREETLSSDAKERLIANQVKLGEAKEAVLQLSDKLQTLRSINQSVFSNMGTAIDNFVRTGKFAFKDFARSVIQDIISIQLKAQATKLLGMAFSAFAPTAGPMQLGGEMQYIGPAFAEGGNPPVGVPSLVGEKGPELFVPRTAGTIIPNNQLASAMQQPQIVYNGPYIASMSAIDTQSATQFLAKNKDAVWSANQSASRGLPASR